MGNTSNPNLGISLAELRDNCPEACDDYDIEINRKFVIKLITKAFEIGNDEGREAFVSNRLYIR